MNEKWILAIIRHWCPEHLRTAEVSMQAVGALLHAVSCVEQERIAARGDTPLRPLDDFPQEAYPPEVMQ